MNMTTNEVPSEGATRSDQLDTQWPDPLGPVATPQLARHTGRKLGLAGYVIGVTALTTLTTTTEGTPACSTGML